MDEHTRSVHSAIYDALTGLDDISEGDRLVEVLTSIKRYLGQGDNPASAKEIAEFYRTHYTPFLRFLAAKMGPQWMELLTSSENLDLWDSYFLQGPADQAFLVLMDSLLQTGPSVRLDCCVRVLEKFLQRDALADVIWQVCEQQLEATPTPVLHEAILAKICSLPDYVANCLQKHNKSVFYPQNYFQLVGNTMLKVLQRVSVSLRDGKGCSINFVSQLLGKVCMQGRQRELFTVLLPRLSALVQSDCIWQRICWRLMESVPDRWMEPVVAGIAEMVPGPSILSQLLGDLVLKNKQTHFVLTKKMMLMMYCNKKLVLQCILGYLAMEKRRRPLLIKVLQDLLEVWSSGSMIKHSPYPQMLHLSRCIFIALSLMTKEEILGCKQDLLQALTSGTRFYLDSSLPPVRSLGMVVAECLSKEIGCEGPSLSFKYENDDDIRDLKSLLAPPCICPSDFGKKPSESSAVPPSKKEEKHVEESKTDSGSESELDSDDDLTPYDMSADTELKKNKTPLYIRDSMEVLFSDDVEKVEVTMSSLATLIRSNTTASKEVSTELAKLLLHLDDRAGVENFTQLRFAAMVAITVTDPVPVSHYLTGEFYAVNYSLRQRMDMLDVLASAAQELSELASTVKPKSSAKPVDPRLFRESVLTFRGEQTGDWRKVVEERIASKTRRFKSQTRDPPVSKRNGFHVVAGHFFFPLIKNFDRPVVTFNLLGEDQIILGRLVHTLGVLMHLAQHATIVSQMGKSLLEFVWVLHDHADPFVRGGLLFCVSTVLLSVPWEMLMTDMADEVLEMKCWLADVVDKDPDDDCRNLAVNGLILMDKLRSNLQSTPA